MKKYIVSVLVATMFLMGAPFAIQQASASDMSIRDFINLLVAIGVIAPDKMPAVNAYLATLDNTQTTTYPSITSLSLNSGTPGTVISIYGSGFNGYLPNQVRLVDFKYVNGIPGTTLVSGNTSSNGSTVTFTVPNLVGDYSVSVINTVNQDSNNVPFTITSSAVSENASGIIKSVYTQSGKNYIDIDYVTLNPNWKPGGMSGSAYTNDNTLIRTFEISPNAKYVIGSLGEGQITFQTFSNLFISTGVVNGISQYSYQKYNPWDIVINNGVVTQIAEHYLP